MWQILVSIHHNLFQKKKNLKKKLKKKNSSLPTYPNFFSYVTWNRGIFLFGLKKINILHSVKGVLRESALCTLVKMSIIMEGPLVYLINYFKKLTFIWINLFLFSSGFFIWLNTWNNIYNMFVLFTWMLLKDSQFISMI